MRNWGRNLLLASAATTNVYMGMVSYNAAIETQRPPPSPATIARTVSDVMESVENQPLESRILAGIIMTKLSLGYAVNIPGIETARIAYHLQH